MRQHCAVLLCCRFQDPPSNRGEKAASTNCWATCTTASREKALDHGDLHRSAVAPPSSHGVMSLVCQNMGGWGGYIGGHPAPNHIQMRGHERARGVARLLDVGRVRDLRDAARTEKQLWPAIGRKSGARINMRQGASVAGSVARVDRSRGVGRSCRAVGPVQRIGRAKGRRSQTGHSPQTSGAGGPCGHGYHGPHAETPSPLQEARHTAEVHGA